MFRTRIRSICNNTSVHPFPIAMRFGGSRRWCGTRLYVMYCPACGVRRYYIYQFGQPVRVRGVA
jgi:hypothetical protein